MQSFEINLKRVYGLLKAYPVDANARDLARIAKTKTLTADSICAARRMGFAVAIQIEGVTMGILEPHQFSTVLAQVTS